jgi:hypothetical protein
MGGDNGWMERMNGRDGKGKKGKASIGSFLRGKRGLMIDMI